MRLSLLFILSLFSLFTVVNAGIEPTLPEVDFGRIREADGPVSRRAFVRNTDTVPLALLKVLPSCGCTAVDFQKDTFSPGDSAWIDLVYDPAMRPGRFDKSVKIYPTEGEMVRLMITGTVEATPATIEYLYPKEAGLLHLTETLFLSRTSLNHKQRSFFADAYNAGDTPVWVEIANENTALETTVSPNPVPPGDKALITLYLDPDNEKRNGVSEYSVFLYNSDSPDNIKTSIPVELKIITDNYGTP